MVQRYDVVVIGGGPGGYVAAVRAAQLGMKVAVIDERNRLGGTCLNVGCIPSKALLMASQKFEEASERFEEIGIERTRPKLNLKRMMAFKNTVIKDNAKGIENLFKKQGVTWIQGRATFKSLRTLSVKPLPKGHRYDVSATHIIIATGSEPIVPPKVLVDEKTIVTNTGALSLEELPKKMIIMGGGVIGLEMGVVWQRFGSQVTILEASDKILPEMDDTVSSTLQKMLEHRGMEFHLGTRVTSAKSGKSSVKVSTVSTKTGERKNMSAKVVLVSIGRKANTQGLNLNIPRVALNDKGQIIVDNNLETSTRGIYAIGDVIDGPMLAHRAEKEGAFLAEIIAGKQACINYNHVPAVVYTSPEAASIGKTEKQLQQENIEYKISTFNFVSNGWRVSMGDAQGFVKILADAKTDDVLGCHIIGKEAGNMIDEVAKAMEFGIASEELAKICHTHTALDTLIESGISGIEPE